MNESNYEKVLGTVRLFYEDPRMGLHVSSMDAHDSYVDPPFCDDGLCDFYAANYDKLIQSFLTLSNQGETCSLHFDLRDEGENTLYSGNISRFGNGEFVVDIFPEWASMWQGQEPTLVDNFPPALHDQDLVKRIVDLCYGGFMATEADCLGKDVNRNGQREEVQFYRAACEYQGKGKLGLLTMLMNEHKPSLQEQVAQAEAKTQSAPMTPAKEKEPSL